VAFLVGFLPVAGAQGAVTLEGRAHDGEASAAAVREAFRAGRAPEDSEKTPLVDTELTVDLLSLAPKSDEAAGKPVKSWKVKTDSTGGFKVETGLDAVPDGHGLVASAVKSGTRIYSPFFLPGTPGQAIHLYPPSESATGVTAHLKVVYDLQEEKDVPGLRFRASLQVMNAGGHLYVGRPAGSRWREIWRLPMPPGAQIVSQKSPQPGSAGWRVSSDGKWLILDTPVPGVCDYALQGAWEVQCVAPARQSLVQTFPVSFNLEPERMSVWCIHQDMDLTSARLGLPPFVDKVPDPFTGEERQFKVLFANESLKAGEDVRVALTVDNAAIGQISRKAFLWVGGFVLLVLLALLLGALLGPEGAPPDLVLTGLGGGDPIDRIAKLDETFEAGQLTSHEYRRSREFLVALAADELGGGSAGPGGSAAGAPSGLSPQVKAILKRIDELDSIGAGDLSSVADRAHLLEALAKALPREREGKPPSNAPPR
jgi:hypothetical protein